MNEATAQRLEESPLMKMDRKFLWIALLTAVLCAPPIAALQASSALMAEDEEAQKVVVVNRRVEISADADGEGVRRCRALVLNDGKEREFRCEMREDGAGPPRAVFFDEDGNEVELENEGLFQGTRMNAFFIGDSGAQAPGIDARGTDVQIIGFGDAGKPRGYLGAHLTDLSPELRRHFGAPTDRGVLLAKIEPDSPAERASLRVGDVITAIDGKGVSDSAAVRRAVRGLEEGETAVLDLWRNGKLLRSTVTFIVKAVPEVDVRRLLWHDGDASGSSFAYQVNRPQVEDAILELHRTLPTAPCADLELRLREMEKKIELLSNQLEGR